MSMERYTYQDGGKWRIRIGDTEHSGQWVDRLAAYEATGLEPEKIEQLKGEVFGLRLDKQELSALGPIGRLRELAQADREGRCVVFQPGYGVVSIYNQKDEDGLYTMKVTGVITKEEYEAALRREQDD